MKPFGIWKYLLILIVLSFGIIYALPNLYTPDPAVQVSYNDSTQVHDRKLQLRLIKTMEEGELTSDIPEVEIHENYALIRLSSSEEQLRVKDVLSSAGNSGDVDIDMPSSQSRPRFSTDHDFFIYSSNGQHELKVVCQGRSSTIKILFRVTSDWS